MISCRIQSSSGSSSGVATMFETLCAFIQSACFVAFWLARGQGGKPRSFWLLGLYRRVRPCERSLSPAWRAGSFAVSRLFIFVNYPSAVPAPGNVQFQARIMDRHAARCRSRFLWGAPPAAPVAVRPSSFQRPLHHVRLLLGELHSVSSTANRSWPPPGSLLARQA